MPTECIANLFGFTPVEGRRVEASFDGGTITSDGGGLLLGSTDRAIGLIERFAQCFEDHRDADLIEHQVRTLVGQRIFGLALGYEDDDVENLSHLWAVVCSG
jgi:Transposase DDE domain group 1